VGVSTARQDERGLLSEGLEHLRCLLGPSWSVRQSRPRAKGSASRPTLDHQWHITSATGGPHTTILVEAKARATPSAAAHTADQLGRIARERHAVPLFLAPWLSPRTREILEQRGVAYLDLTGNVHLRLEMPAVLIHTEGADRNPEPMRTAKRGLSGAQAGRLVRELVDHMPPRQPRELARAAAVSESYVSRLLELMTAEALITRKGKLVDTIDWRGLLRARAATYQLMAINRVVPMIARQGVGRVIDRLEAGHLPGLVRVTGTYAAHRIAPHAVGGAVMIYVSPVSRVEDIGKHLALLRATSLNDADVVVLIPPNSAAFDRPGPAELFGRLPSVGLSQLVLDCLTGPGRMPAEAEELLNWMKRHEPDWRCPSPFVAMP
jgi:hypothetical protein